MPIDIIIRVYTTKNPIVPQYMESMVLEVVWAALCISEFQFLLDPWWFVCPVFTKCDTCSFYAPYLVVTWGSNLIMLFLPHSTFEFISMPLLLSSHTSLLRIVHIILIGFILKSGGSWSMRYFFCCLSITSFLHLRWFLILLYRKVPDCPAYLLLWTLLAPAVGIVRGWFGCLVSRSQMLY